MKLAILLLFFTVTTQWETNFDNAKKTAKEKHELILLNFSGSDWCGPCIMLHKEYFGNEVFASMAEHNLVMVNADFPRKKKNSLTPEMVKHNEALAEKYNKEGYFPFTLLLNADGKVLKTWRGKPEVSPEEWTAQIKALSVANQ